MISHSKHIKKDYQKKNLRNPFFHKRTTGKKSGLWKWLIPPGILILGGLVWFFLASSFWKLENITISGLNRVLPEEVENIIWQIADNNYWLGFSGRNIFILDDQLIQEKLIASYNLTDCQVIKKFPRSLLVTGYERPYAFIWQEGKDFFYASRDGYIIKEQEVLEEDKQKYFILENKNTGSLIGQDNKINVNSEYLEFAFVLSELINNNDQLTLEKFIIDWEFNTLKVKFKDGPQVYFNTRDQAKNQLERLLLVKKEKIKDNFSKTEYIDLRYGDKIFINPDFK